MAAHSTTTASVQPTTFRFSPALKGGFAVFALGGALAFLAGVKMNPDRAWPAFLVNFFFFLALGLSGAFFTALQHITNAFWSVTVRRIAEGLTAYLPVAFLLALALLVGKHHLYEWTHAEVVAKDALLSSKSAYLNPNFFLIRILVFFGIWIGFTTLMRRNSLAQDASGDHKFTLRNVKLSAAFIPLFAISFSFMGFDLLMSLEPHWFSTIYGVYCFAGLFFSGLSLLALLAIYGRKTGAIPANLMTENHTHDLGKLMFGFTVFWMYIAFSQFMLIWYANLPEETPYYLLRMNSGWMPYVVALFTAHFLIPFFGLLPRGRKRNQSYLQKMAMFMLFAQLMDVYFLVYPVFFKNGPVFGWIEAGTTLGFLGIFGTTITWYLGRVPAVPVRDPRMEKCLAHSQ